MAFVDHVTINVSSGKGGNGVVRWLRNKMKARGGPSGGDGGRGGDVVLVGKRDLSILARYRYEKKFAAEAGEDGAGDLQTGSNGAHLELPVPVGTLIRIVDTGEAFEISEEEERRVLFEGGTGGLGNARFKSSTHQNPFEQTNGRPGKGGDIELTLKIIADAGLVGLPNAGKSSLLNALTRAKSKVGAYAFTTLEPHLGDFHGYILADIPGLIEGASSGRGLGTKFLQHVERTKILLHLVSAEQDDPIAAYREVRNELEAFGHELGSKQELVLLSKAELLSKEMLEKHLENLAKETGREVLAVSVHDPELLKSFSDRLAKLLANTSGS
jgi:GTP-binding protein